MGPQRRKPFLHVFILGKKSLKIFSRINRPISIKLDTNHPCIKGIRVFTNQGPGHLQRGDNCKNSAGSSNFFSQEPQGQKNLYLLKSFVV
jgi:hypothetical protein